MTNRLAEATSPYLLQHKDNPVDWYPWGEDAFARARERDVPVLLSVGYAACHWCHVMAYESFEDPSIAEEMNRLFVNVKVDREERPDVDSIYMEAVQAMTGHGGWPMTVWLDHEARPFFAGTYFPKEPRHGMPGFRQVMEAVSAAWRTSREEVAEQAKRLVEAISHPVPLSELPDATGLERAYQQVAASFDHRHGGFGNAPKFPQQPVLEFLLRVRREPWAPQADAMLAKTLDEMAKGGIHDHLGGGFARYSVDSRWLVPHFEKMLYDNAQLARLYLWAGVELDRPDFIVVARNTLSYLERDLSHPDGAFFSSEDADSEGEEGKFYVWTWQEMHEVLDQQTAQVAAYFGVTEEGNFEGSNVLNITDGEPPAGLAEAKERLFSARKARVRPGLDDKVIISWNGLAIRAFAEAGAALADRNLIETARRAAGFLLEHLVVDGRLMRSWRDGRTSVPGFLEDHASLALALFSLYSATGQLEWYQEAMSLVGSLDRFRGPEGRLYATASDAETLVKRPTDISDNPHPSGNALAAEAMFLAGLYRGDQLLREQAAAALRSVSMLMDRFPSMVGHHLAVLHSMGRAKELAVVGDDWAGLSRVYWESFRPHVVLAPATSPTDQVPLLAGRGGSAETLAYVCRNFVCDLPTSDPGRLAEQLTADR